MITDKPVDSMAVSDEDFVKPFLDLDNQAKLFETMQN